jgi:hypothetical protein
VGLVVLVALLVGCGGPRRAAGPVPDRPSGLTALGQAITAFDAARAVVLRTSEDVIVAALALDAADEACAAGATQTATAARSRVRVAVPKARIALAALPSRLTTYARALSTLQAARAAAAGLSAEQRSALDAVVAGGRAEAAATDAFRVAGKTAWPAYADLDAAESTWLDRRLAGWYRDQKEAAAAYAVLVRDGRPALLRARTLLQRVDAARRPMSDRERRAVLAADAALQPLRSPG